MIHRWEMKKVNVPEAVAEGSTYAYTVGSAGVICGTGLGDVTVAGGFADGYQR